MRNKLAQKIKLGAALLLMAGTSAFAQTSNQIYTPTPENIKARQEFQDNKFGIFLHWGIYRYDRPRRMVYEHSQHQP